MRWCVSIGAVLAAGAIVAGDVASVAAPDPRSQLAAAKDNQPSVDVELVIAVDISYSMDLDELAVQREGYAQAIVSKEFLQAMKSGPNSKVAVTFSGGKSGDQKIIIPVADRRPRKQRTLSPTRSCKRRSAGARFRFRRDQFRNAAVQRESLSRLAACRVFER